MRRFIDGEDRMQQALLPHCLEDYVSDENPVRVIEVFIDELGLASLGFSGMTPAALGRPAYRDAAEDLPLRPPQPRSVEPAVGTRSAAKCRVDVADRAVGTRLQGCLAILAGRAGGVWAGGAGNRDSLPAWGIDNNLTRGLSAADPVQIALIQGLVANSMNFVMGARRGRTSPPDPWPRRGGSGRVSRIRGQSGSVCSFSSGVGRPSVTRRDERRFDHRMRRGERKCPQTRLWAQTRATAAPIVAGVSEAGDCGGKLGAGRVGVAGGAALRRERQPGFRLAAALSGRARRNRPSFACCR